MTTTSPTQLRESGDVAFDPSARAGATLDHILDTELSAQAKERQSFISVEEGLHGQRVLDQRTGRTKSRILFVTTDESVLATDSSVQTEYRTLATYFDEVHVMVLVAREGADTHERITPNMWVYQVHARYWWRLPWAAATHAYAALTFNGAVRPDIVVAKDPFESGLAAYFIARDFARPVQVHISTNFDRPGWLEADRRNTWRRRMARHVLKRVMSVRTNTNELEAHIKKHHPKVADIRTLPQFYNFNGLLTNEVSGDIHTKYQQFAFIFVAFGPLTADSHLHDTFSALRSVLLNKRIGLIVVGRGPAKSLFTEKTDILGVTESVVFMEEAPDLTTLLKTADAMVCTDVTQAGDRLTMQSAAAGLPLLAYETELRLDLFKDGESAFLVPADDVALLGQKATKLLNDQALRITFARNAKEMAVDRLQEDPESYYQAFRDTIETILVPRASNATTDTHEETKTTTTDTNRT